MANLAVLSYKPFFYKKKRVHTYSYGRAGLLALKKDAADTDDTLCFHVAKTVMPSTVPEVELDEIMTSLKVNVPYGYGINKCIAIVLTLS